MDVVRSFMPMVVSLGFFITGLKMASTGNKGLLHFYHLVGVPPLDRERLGRAVGLCFAVAGAGASLGGIPFLAERGEACSAPAAAGAAARLILGSSSRNQIDAESRQRCSHCAAFGALAAPRPTAGGLIPSAPRSRPGAAAGTAS